MIRIGVDVGGTFTDLIMVDDNDGRRIEISKVPTTVDNQADGVMNAIAGTDVDLAAVESLVHGTTTTTNAMLERKIAKCGLITTAGFRDVLELGRRTRPAPYGMTGTFEPLIAREYRMEVPERVTAEGDVLTPLNPEDVKSVCRELIDLGCEALVIHFLHSYANPEHELMAYKAAKEVWPNDYITIGHAILSEYREYERGTTASVNAAVQPILDRYLARLRNTLADGGYKHDLLVMQGNGGTLSSEVIAEDAIKTVMSGPASGVMAAAFTASSAGYQDVISYDMGGTSSDVALIRDGIPAVSSDLELEYAVPIHVPMVDVQTIGAGGGSIAYINDAGMLQVGPESAGASPGPICYGRGGTRPTITDANLVLGRLPADKLLAVDNPVTVEQVLEIIGRDIGAPLGLSAEDAAAAIVRIANDKMAGAIRMVSLTRGHDPRDFALFAFGGAGPLHASAIAREIGIPNVLIPPRPGITNAIGCVVADARHDFVQTVNTPLHLMDMGEATAILRSQIEDGKKALEREKTKFDDMIVLHSADMQFQGQTHLLRVKLARDDLSRDELYAAFEKAYFDRFAVTLPEVGAALVNLNTSIIGQRQGAPADWLVDPSGLAPSLDDALIGKRDVWFQDGPVDTPVYDRLKLPIGSEFIGPAIVQQLDCTTVVQPGNTVKVDDNGNLVISVETVWRQ